MAKIKRIRAVMKFIEENAGDEIAFNMKDWVRGERVKAAVIANDPNYQFGEEREVFKVRDEDKSTGCGTSMCYAGWAAFYDGRDIRSSKWGQLEVAVRGGETIDFESWGAEYFGLTYYQAEEIFHYRSTLSSGRTTIEDLKKHINEVLDEIVFPEVVGA